MPSPSSPHSSCPGSHRVLYVLVALMWVVPDRRIERSLAAAGLTALVASSTVVRRGVVLSFTGCWRFSASGRLKCKEAKGEVLCAAAGGVVDDAGALLLAGFAPGDDAYGCSPPLMRMHFARP